jgi:hypothetical protein
VITFSVTNRSKESFEFSEIGANRGSHRDVQFRVRAVDENGRPVKNPNSNRSEVIQGMLGEAILRLGDSHIEWLFLGRWCEFERPGTYTVTCQRTLRPSIGAAKYRAVGVTTNFELTVLPYDREKMRQIIAALGRKIEETPVGREEDLDDLVAQRYPELAARYRTRTTGPEGNDIVEQWCALRRKIAEDNADLLRMVTLSLASIHDEAVIPHLKAALMKPHGPDDFTYQYPAVEGLSQFKTEKAVEAMVFALKSRIGHVRCAAVRGLGNTKSKHVLEPIAAALEDKDNYVRYAAAEAIGALGDPRGIEPLKRCLTSDDLGLRVCAGEARVRAII